MKRAFTFAELMISLVIISVITALLYPTISELAPNNNKHLFKATYRTLENTVQAIVSGEIPSDDLSMTGRVAGEMPVGAHNTCQAFEYLLNTVSPDNGIAACAGGGGRQYLQTTNGVRWYFEQNADMITTIIVDVNSANNSNGDSDNLQDEEKDNDGNIIKARIANPWEQGSFYNRDNTVQDTFIFAISKTGKITVAGDMARRYITDTEGD